MDALVDAHIIHGVAVTVDHVDARTCYHACTCARVWRRRSWVGESTGCGREVDFLWCWVPHNY